MKVPGEMGGVLIIAWEQVQSAIVDPSAARLLLGRYRPRRSHYRQRPLRRIRLRRIHELPWAYGQDLGDELGWNVLFVRLDQVIREPSGLGLDREGFEGI
jgi:hypothetical protein